MKFPKYDPAGSAPAAPPPSNRQGAASLRVSPAPGKGRLPPQPPPSWLGLSTWAALGAVLVAAPQPRQRSVAVKTGMGERPVVQQPCRQMG